MLAVQAEGAKVVTIEGYRAISATWHLQPEIAAFRPPRHALCRIHP
jgi:hypothetical protein